MKICIREVALVDKVNGNKVVTIPPQYCHDEDIPYVEVFSIAAREAISVRQKYGFEDKPGYARTVLEYEGFAGLLTTLADEMSRGVKSVFAVLDRSEIGQSKYVPHGHEDAVVGEFGMFHSYVVGNVLHIKLEKLSDGEKGTG